MKRKQDGEKMKVFVVIGGNGTVLGVYSEKKLAYVRKLAGKILPVIEMELDAELVNK